MRIVIDDIGQEIRGKYDDGSKVGAGTEFCLVTVEENPTSVLITAYSNLSRVMLMINDHGGMNVTRDYDWNGGIVFDKKEPAPSLAAKAGS
jgi:hypothetical protein